MTRHTAASATLRPKLFFFFFSILFLLWTPQYQLCLHLARCFCLHRPPSAPPSITFVQARFISSHRIVVPRLPQTIARVVPSPPPLRWGVGGRGGDGDDAPFGLGWMQSEEEGGGGEGLDAALLSEVAFKSPVDGGVGRQITGGREPEELPPQVHEALLFSAACRRCSHGMVW